MVAVPTGVSRISPSPVRRLRHHLSVLSRENNGVASEDLLAVVRNALNGEDVRPVADRVTVQSAAIVEYQINATLYLYPGPESDLHPRRRRENRKRTSRHSTGWGATSVCLPFMPPCMWKACSVSNWLHRWPISRLTARRRLSVPNTAS